MLIVIRRYYYTDTSIVVGSGKTWPQYMHTLQLVIFESIDQITPNSVVKLFNDTTS